MQPKARTVRDGAFGMWARCDHTPDSESILSLADGSTDRVCPGVQLLRCCSSPLPSGEVLCVFLPVKFAWVQDFDEVRRG